MTNFKFFTAVSVLFPILCGCTHDSAAPSATSGSSVKPAAKGRTIVGSWTTDQKFTKATGSDIYTFEDDGSFKEVLNAKSDKGLTYSHTASGIYTLKTNPSNAQDVELAVNAKEATDVDWHGKVSHLTGKDSGKLFWQTDDCFSVLFGSRADSIKFTRQH